MKSSILKRKIRMALQNRIEIINFLCLGFMVATNNLLLKIPCSTFNVKKRCWKLKKVKCDQGNTLVQKRLSEPTHS